MPHWAVILLALGYLAVLFLFAFLLDKKGRKQQDSRLGKWIYALAIPVYCTAWTYYGSVGKAVTDGWEFLTIYLGPILTVPIWWLVVRKMIRLCDVQRISTLPDFISSRYNNSLMISALSTVFIVLGIIPYISIQLKSISSSFEIVTDNASLTAGVGFFEDTALYISLLLAIFIIVFVFRSIETTDKHYGLMGAIAVDSIVKLLAFLVVGGFVTYSLFDGFGDLFGRLDEEALDRFMSFPSDGGMNWIMLLFLSMSAIILLPRQFQVMVAENTSENHLKTAVWIVPLYLLLINIFVVPIAIGGQVLMPHVTDPDTFVLAIPMISGNTSIAALTFIGGFSASTGMIIVSTIALSLMVSNSLVVPFKVWQTGIKSGYAIQVRKVIVVIILILAYLYYRFIADRFPIVSIGLISFAAMIQFVPAVLGALYWRDAHRNGVLFGLIGGFIFWAYTLVLPTIIQVGLLPDSILREGLFGIAQLRPESLFGFELSPIAHGAFWSLLVNALIFLGVSLFSSQSPKELNMADFYVDIYKNAERSEERILWKGQLVFKDLVSICENILGVKRTKEVINHYERYYGNPLTSDNQVDSRFVNYAERMLSGAVGSASARMIISSISKEEEIEFEEVVKILKESTEVGRLNTELRLKSGELRRRTRELESANARLRNLDEEKDDFISTVTHELRTPLTSIKAFVEILEDNPEMDGEQQAEFLRTMNSEIDRMTRLINEVLDIEKLESGSTVIAMAPVRPSAILMQVILSLKSLMDSSGIRLETDFDKGFDPFSIHGDEDRLKQVFINILSNAIKYSDKSDAFIHVRGVTSHKRMEITVTDNGRGIDPESMERIFDKFYQARDQTRKKPKGTGLGLSITKKIVELHGGQIDVESEWGSGCRFKLIFPGDGNEENLSERKK